MTENIPENTYQFVIRKSLSRLSNLFCVSWIAIWNGNLYSNLIDINRNNFIKDEDFFAEISKTLSELQINMIDSYQNIDKNLDKGLRNIEELHSSLIPESNLTIVDADIVSLLEKAKKQFS